MSGLNSWADLMLLWCWQALVLVGLILLIARFARSSSAAQRHQLWLLGLALIALLPVVDMVVRQGYVKLPRIAPFGSISLLPERTPFVSYEVSLAAPATANPLEMPSKSRANALAGDSFKTVLLGLWAVGVLISVGRTCAGWWTTRRLRRLSRPAEIPGAVRVAYSAETTAPMLVGVWRPMILLPEMMQGWSDEERRAVLLHERAHFERRDHLVNLLQAFLGAALFFHPAVRFALGRLATERELACDESVLLAGVQPSIYLEAIMKVAERGVMPQPGLHSAFNSPRKILERRIQMITTSRPSASRGSRWLVPMKATAVLSVAFLLPSGQLVTAQTPAAAPQQPRPVQRLAPAAAPVAAASVASPTPVRRPATPGIVASPAPALPAVAVVVEPAPAQAQPARLSGTVADQSGAVIPGVSVMVGNPATGEVVQAAVTGESGAYEINLPSGDYLFRASLPGFLDHRRSLQIRPGANSQNATLYVAGVSAQVEVSAARPATPAPPPVQTLPVRVGGDISAPTLISSPKPVYPPGARARDVQDSVSLVAVVAIDGSVESVMPDPARGVARPDLVQSAMDAVRQWRFRPAILNGQPIAVPLNVTVRFTLVDGN